MTTQVDFYLLSASHPGGRSFLACRLAEIAYRRGHKVWVHTDDSRQAKQLDDLLWTFSQGSFVPHQLSPGPDQEILPSNDYPVIIATHDAPDAVDDVLISLLPDVPQYYERFKRVLDPVGFDDADKQRGRSRFRHYRNAGIEPNKHDLKTN